MAEVEAFDAFTVSVARETWGTFRREPILFLIAGLVVMATTVLSLGVLTGPINIGFIELVRKVRAGEPVAVSVLFSRMDSFIPSSVALFLISVVAFLGFLMLVLPGIAVLFFVTWTLPIIAYERTGGVDAIRQSVALVRAFPMHTLALGFALLVLHFVAGMLVLGVVIALPLGSIAFALGYERLASASEPMRSGIASAL